MCRLPGLLGDRGPVGWAVIPATYTRRVRCSGHNKHIEAAQETGRRGRSRPRGSRGPGWFPRRESRGFGTTRLGLECRRWRLRLIFTAAWVRCRRSWAETGHAQRSVCPEEVQRVSAVEPADADDRRENDRPQNVDHLGLSLVHWSGGQHGCEAYEPDRSALAMVLRRLCVRYSGNVPIWPGRRGGDSAGTGFVVQRRATSARWRRSA
jgi:hypothetical protein